MSIFVIGGDCFSQPDYFTGNLMEHLRKNQFVLLLQTKFISTAILEIKLNKKLHTFKTRYVNKHAMSRYLRIKIELQ